MQWTAPGLVLLVVLAGCAAPPDAPVLTPPASPTPSADPPGPTVHGIGWTAAAAALGSRFWDDARQAGGVVSWSGDVAHLGPDGPAADVAWEAAARGLDVLIVASPLDPDQPGFSGPFGPEERAAHTRAVAELLRAHNVRYLGLGLDVDVWWVGASDVDRDTFTDWYEATRAAAKDASPGTNVFPVFRHEQLQDGFGPRWAILDTFPDRDFLAVTTRPADRYAAPADVPADHYRGLEGRDEPVAVVAVSWPAANETAQADFTARLPALLDAARLVVWSPSHDDADGLKGADGTARPAWGAWVGTAGQD